MFLFLVNIVLVLLRSSPHSSFDDFLRKGSIVISKQQEYDLTHVDVDSEAIEEKQVVIEDIPIINEEKKGHQYDGILVFRPSESGLANNMLGLVSAFIMSTLSNRKLYCNDFPNG